MNFNKHTLHKNNAIAGVMYELYLDGRSLANIVKIYCETRQAICDTFRLRGFRSLIFPVRLALNT